MALTVDACAAQHQGDRKEQQDRLAILAHPRQRGVVLAVVADGMGGHSGGALAAEQVVHTARNSLEHFSPSSESPLSLLEDTLLEAHAMIKSARLISEKDPHSTAVMLLLQARQATWVHCGDSRVYHFQHGRLVTRSVDHSYVEHLIASGRITPEEAATHPNRNLLITSLGGKEAPKFDFGGAGSLADGDSFVLCSDGLWAYFDDEEMGAIVAANPARKASQILIEQARQRAGGAGDNLSLVIIKLNEPEPALGAPLEGAPRR
jgi:PPM family protein phosphatase